MVNIDDELEEEEGGSTGAAKARRQWPTCPPHLTVVLLVESLPDDEVVNTIPGFSTSTLPV